MSIDEVIENLSFFEDWEQRYAYIIELGDKLPPLPEEQKTEANKVTGCLSQVWFISEKNPTDKTRYTFHADSDARIVKGLVALLLIIYNNKTAEEIRQVPLEEIFAKLNLENHLSMNRRNGFFSMVSKIKQLAAE